VRVRATLIRAIRFRLKPAFGVHLLVAFFKARLVLMVFMAVSGATVGIRRACEVRVITACTGVLVSYWFAPFTVGS
jgi:hypothetical protein